MKISKNKNKIVEYTKSSEWSLMKMAMNKYTDKAPLPDHWTI